MSPGEVLWCAGSLALRSAHTRWVGRAQRGQTPRPVQHQPPGLVGKGGSAHQAVLLRLQKLWGEWAGASGGHHGGSSSPSSVCSTGEGVQGFGNPASPSHHLSGQDPSGRPSVPFGPSLIHESHFLCVHKLLQKICQMPGWLLNLLCFEPGYLSGATDSYQTTNSNAHVPLTVSGY